MVKTPSTLRSASSLGRSKFSLINSKSSDRSETERSFSSSLISSQFEKAFDSYKKLARSYKGYKKLAGTYNRLITS